MDTDFHYYAFISYSTKDSKWAKWLRRRLSYYHIPASVKKSKVGVPDKLQPIFIYEYDLSGNLLHNVIQKELLASKYLIVICSPEAARSKYVNDEVQTFIDQGRERYIIPFIVGGQPNSTDPATECFPPALLNLLRCGDKNKEIRGANIATNGKHQALVDVVATMLGVRRDEIWNSYRARQVCQRVAMVAVAVVALFSALLYWDYTRSTYRYFADYVDVWGVPSGVVEIDSKARAQRNGTYRFEYRRIPLGQTDAYNWRLAEVSYVNSVDRPREISLAQYNDRYPIQKLVYSPQNGVLTDIVYCDENGREQLQHRLSRRGSSVASIVDIESAVAGESISFSKSFSLLSDAKEAKSSRIVRYLYERNSDGYITKMTYHANNDPNFSRSAVADNNGVWGVAFDLDSLGRRVAVHYLNQDGSYYCNKIGVASRHYKYDAQGAITECRVFNLADKPIVNEYLWATAVSTIDSHGNIIQEEYYGVDGKPCLHKDGYAKVLIYDDDSENVSEATFYGIDGKPCYGLYGVAKISARYDNSGDLVEYAFYSVNGKPCLNKDHIAKYVVRYDERGNVVESATYGLDNKLCLDVYGVAKYLFVYDERGNVVEASYYGVDGKPCLCMDGVAKVVAKYDDRGDAISETYYGLDGNPCMNIGGFAKSTSRYDERGNRVERAYHGLDGNLCLRQGGYAKWIAQFDDRGNEVECAYYGVDGKLCLSDDGYAKCVSKYDDRGNMVETTLYGVDGKPCLDKYGVAKVVYLYDERGNLTVESYYGVDGKPCLNGSDFAKAVFQYDERGNEIEKVLYGLNGKLLRRTVYEHDERTKVVSVTDYDQNGDVIN